VPQSGSLDAAQSEFELGGNETVALVNCVQASYISSTAPASPSLAIVAPSFHWTSIVGGRGMGGAGGAGGAARSSSEQLVQAGQAGQRGWPAGHQPCAKSGGAGNGAGGELAEAAALLSSRRLRTSSCCGPTVCCGRTACCGRTLLAPARAVAPPVTELSIREQFDPPWQYP
jgi:hypothetical protein